MSPRLSELPELTGLRGFAALWVLLFHVWGLAGQPHLLPPVDVFFGTGWAGVDLFFTLSAFLLTLPFAAWRLGAAPRPVLRTYFLRRVLRIFPAYYAQLALLLGLAALFGIGRMLDGREFGAHLVLWLLLGDPPVMPLNGVWFTLPIEFAFYLVLPLLVFGLGTRRWIALLAGAIVLTFAYRWHTYHAAADLPQQVRVNLIERLPGRLDQFVLGMLAAYAYVGLRLKRWSLPAPPAVLAGAGALGLAALCVAIWLVREVYWEGHPLLYVWHTLASIALAALLLGAAVGTHATRALLANRPLRYLGEVSFGVYLWHVPILGWLLPWVAEYAPGVRLALLLPATLSLTLVAAQLSYVLIERPALHLGRRRTAHPGLVSELPG